MKKLLAVLLSVLMLLSCFGFVSFAGSTAKAGSTGTFNILCYNVAGLPDWNPLVGKEARGVEENQAVIGKFVEEHQYDIFATQEDFFYHDTLVDNLPSYNYQTHHKGSVPYGDGTNTYTRSFPMYNEEHITWNSLYGVADDGADELSQKGITYCCIEIADGVLIDFYNIHADAYDDAGSRAARLDNFHQLRDLINSRTVDRPVIITGDFNEYYFGGYHNFADIFVGELGMKDSWIEICNNGNYEDCTEYESKMNAAGIQRWGNWDSAERFFYKDGGGISLKCDDFEYLGIYTESGRNCSDHSACYGAFTYTVNTDTDTSGDELVVTEENSFYEFIRRVVVFFSALMNAITNFDKVRAYLGF